MGGGWVTAFRNYHSPLLFSLHLGRMLQRLFCLGSISVAMGRAFQEVIVGVINCGLVLHGVLCVGVGVRVFVCARKSLMTVSEP